MQSHMTIAVVDVVLFEKEVVALAFSKGNATGRIFSNTPCWEAKTFNTSALRVQQANEPPAVPKCPVISNLHISSPDHVEGPSS